MAGWAEQSAPIIAQVIQRVGKGDIKALRGALRDAYPFGERRGYPYIAWLNEIKRQVGHPLIKPHRHPYQRDLFESVNDRA